MNMPMKGYRTDSDSLPLSSGVIRTALPNMDRETRDQYVLVIQAKDMVGQMGGLSGTTSVTVTLTDVNDNPPRFTHSKTPRSWLSLRGQLSVTRTQHAVFLRQLLCNQQ